MILYCRKCGYPCGSMPSLLTTDEDIEWWNPHVCGQQPTSKAEERKLVERYGWIKPEKLD